MLGDKALVFKEKVHQPPLVEDGWGLQCHPAPQNRDCYIFSRLCIAHVEWILSTVILRWQAYFL